MKTYMMAIFATIIVVIALLLGLLSIAYFIDCKMEEAYF